MHGNKHTDIVLDAGPLRRGDAPIRMLLFVLEPLYGKDSAGLALEGSAIRRASADLRAAALCGELQYRAADFDLIIAILQETAAHSGRNSTSTHATSGSSPFAHASVACFGGGRGRARPCCCTP